VSLFAFDLFSSSFFSSFISNAFSTKQSRPNWLHISYFCLLTFYFAAKRWNFNDFIVGDCGSRWFSTVFMRHIIVSIKFILLLTTSTKIKAVHIAWWKLRLRKLQLFSIRIEQHSQICSSVRVPRESRAEFLVAPFACRRSTRRWNWSRQP
jgi:hypothetical protein